MAETFSVLSLLDKPPVQIVEKFHQRRFICLMAFQSMTHKSENQTSTCFGATRPFCPVTQLAVDLATGVVTKCCRPAASVMCCIANKSQHLQQLDLDCDRAGCNIAGFVVLHLRIYAFLAAPAETKTCVLFRKTLKYTHTDSTTPAKGPSHHRLQRLVSECGRECHFHSWWSLFQ